MKKLVLNPDRRKCSLEDCPPGLFVFEGQVCFKTEYFTEAGKVEAFNRSGEAFDAGDNIQVQPVVAEWEDS